MARWESAAASRHAVLLTRMATSFQFTHPEMASRVSDLLDLPEFSGWGISSTWRTYATQKRLYDGWRAGKPGYNLAANPDRVMGTAQPEGFVAKGSWHQVQINGWSYAVDLAKPWHVSKSAAARHVDHYAPQMGLRRTVPTEWWHVQCRNLSGWFPDPRPQDPSVPIPPELENLEMIALLVDTTTDEKWVVDAGKAVLLTSPEAWSGHNLTRVTSPAMRHVIPRLYQVV